MGLRAWLRRETARIRDDWHNLGDRTDEVLGIRVTPHMVYEGIVQMLYSLAMVALGGLLATKTVGELILRAQCISGDHGEYTPYTVVDETCANTISGILNPILEANLITFVVLLFSAFIVDHWLVAGDEDV